jgi:hypothetical protein
MHLKFPIFLFLVLLVPALSCAAQDWEDASWYNNYTVQTTIPQPSFFDTDDQMRRDEPKISQKRDTPPKTEKSASIPNGDYTSHVLCYYTRIVELLEKFGFNGPFAEELAKFALLRQLIEDGTNRPHTVSMVGMVPGGLNKKVVEKMGLKHGETNEVGLKLTRVTANDGQGSYALYGPLANVWSCLAIVLVWDEYINSGQFSIKQDLISAWNLSKELSCRIAQGDADRCAKDTYETELSQAREKAIKRVNQMYGPGSSSIEGLVKSLEPMFSLKLAKMQAKKEIERRISCLFTDGHGVIQMCSGHIRLVP